MQQLKITDADRSQSACSWVELNITHGVFSELAYLPLRSIHRLKWGELELPSPCPVVKITLHGASDWPSGIRDAIANLGHCPAWQLSGHTIRCYLDADSYEVDDVEPLLETVEALSGFASKELQLSIDDTWDVEYDASLLEQLSRVRGTSLTHLEIRAGHISRDFWPAVWTHLPRLNRLSLAWLINKESIYPQDVVAFCIRAARPLQLWLVEGLEEAVGPAEGFNELGRVWGVPQQVTVEFQGERCDGLA
jgi:hypothetical protein